MGRRAPERWATEAKAAGIEGLSGPTLRRLRDDYPSRLTTDVHDAIEKFLSWRPLAALARDDPGIGTEPERAGEIPTDQFLDFESVLGYVQDIVDDDEELTKMRRVNAVDHYRGWLTARGPLPEWWWRLKQMVETDQLPAQQPGSSGIAGVSLDDYRREAARRAHRIAKENAVRNLADQAQAGMTNPRPGEKHRIPKRRRGHG